MIGSKKWSVIVTLIVIFGTGLVIGLWLNRNAPHARVPHILFDMSLSKETKPW